MRLVVDMHPGGATIAGDLDGALDEAGADAAAAMAGVNGWIEQEGVDAAVPRDIDIADQSFTFIGAQMNQAARPDRG